MSTTAADLTDWVETDLPRLLPAFLPKQRWFGGKGRAIQAVGFNDAAWLTGARAPSALVIVGVRYADGGGERYALLLAFVDRQGGLPLVGPVGRPVPAMWAVEAATDADAARALLGGFFPPREIQTTGGGTLRYDDVTDAATRVLAGAGEALVVRPVGVEQSNTSLRLDRSLVFKLFRKLDDGENPELEVCRFLTTRTTFRAMPSLQGSLTCRFPNGDSATVGVLQEWIENRGDGWSYVVAQLREPPDGTGGEALLRDLFALGATTADFHAALASDDATAAFAPHPATAADVTLWQGALLERTAQALALVERNVAGWPDDLRDLGRSLLGLRDRATAIVQVPDVAMESSRFHKIRVHGDYHLGQTLKTADGFVLIDFEGEPARPLAERRLKHCALKDVAGMIRSFDYAVETVRAEEPNRADDRLTAVRLREAFLDGYRSSAAGHRATFLPQDRGAFDQWVNFFEIERALYEVDYEINNRPAWAHIPLKGIVRILRGQA